MRGKVDGYTRAGLCNVVYRFDLYLFIIQYIFLNRNILLLLNTIILFNLLALKIFISNLGIYNILNIIYIKFWVVNIIINFLILIYLLNILSQ